MVAGFGAHVEAQLERVPRLQHNAPLSEAADANLGPLKVSQNTHIAPMVAGLLADKSRNLCVIGLGTMAEIQAKYIHARGEQTPDHILTAARRTDRGDDFGSAQRGRLV